MLHVQLHLARGTKHAVTCDMFLFYFPFDPNAPGRAPNDPRKGETNPFVNDGRLSVYWVGRKMPQARAVFDKSLLYEESDAWQGLKTVNVADRKPDSAAFNRVHAVLLLPREVPPTVIKTGINESHAYGRALLELLGQHERSSMTRSSRDKCHACQEASKLACVVGDWMRKCRREHDEDVIFNSSPRADGTGLSYSAFIHCGQPYSDGSHVRVRTRTKGGTARSKAGAARSKAAETLFKTSAWTSAGDRSRR